MELSPKNGIRTLPYLPGSKKELLNNLENEKKNYFHINHNILKFIAFFSLTFILYL